MKDKKIVLPNGMKITLKEFLDALISCLYDEQEQIIYNIKKTTKKAKKAAFVSTLVVAMTASCISHKKSDNNDIQKFAEELIDNSNDLDLKAGVSLDMTDDIIAPKKAGVAIQMSKIPEVINYDNNIQIEQKDNETKYENIFVGYDLPDVKDERKETVKEYQKILYEKCQKYDVPFNVMMVIFDNESGGLFNTNGVINQNKNGTADYGLFQINSCNFETIKKDLGITSDELLNEPEKNIEASCYFVKNIIDRYGEKHIDEMKQDIYTFVFGVYNGGGDYRKNTAASKYALKGQEKMMKKYNKTIDELTKIRYFDKEDENVKTR